MEKIPAKSVAVVCEYNPYHYGHKYQTELLSKEYETVVGIMSGDFVQRGEVAVADKYLRAAAAVDNGMNLMLELPFPYCCLSARDFAFSAVQIAVSVGVDALAFGAEAGEDGKELLFQIADLIDKESFKADLKAKIKGQGVLSYARARALLVSEQLGREAGEMLSKPNSSEISLRDISPRSIKTKASSIFFFDIYFSALVLFFIKLKERKNH